MLEHLAPLGAFRPEALYIFLWVECAKGSACPSFIVNFIVSGTSGTLGSHAEASALEVQQLRRIEAACFPVVRCIHFAALKAHRDTEVQLSFLFLFRFVL